MRPVLLRFAALPATVESRFGVARAAFLWALVAFLLLNLVAYPYPLEGIVAGEPHRALQMDRYRLSFVPLSADPFNAQTPNAPQFRLRLLAPLLTWALHVPAPYSALIPYLSTLPALFVAAILLRRHVSASITVLAVLLLALNHPFVTSNCWLSYPDSLAAGFILLTMLVRTPSAVTPLLFAAMLTDERSLTAYGLVLCWHYYLDTRDRPEQAKRRAVFFILAGMGAALCWALYAGLMLRHLHLSLIDLAAPAWYPLSFTLPRAPFHIFFAFRAAWALPLAALFFIFLDGKHTRFAFAAAAACVPILLSSLTIADTSRVIAIALPLLPLSLLVLRDQRPGSVPALVSIPLALNLVCPVVLGIVVQAVLVQPTPLVLVLRLMGVPYKP